MNTVISVENLSKCYQLGVINTGTFYGDLQRWWARQRGLPDPHLKIGVVDHGNRQGETLWALKDINLQVQQGEALGIIGRNGAGKSTLLKILSRVAAPTSGEVKIKGRIASLLEVGTGFHGELTGRENIYLNGAIMGMDRREIQRKFDEIVDFSGVEQFIDTPVKRYSSGMYVRLAFAVAAHLDPEILVVDEVLSVGDADFQKKSLEKMEKNATSGRTVVYVSHNLPSVIALCSRAIWLENGKIAGDGGIHEIVQRYLDSNSQQENLWQTLANRIDRNGNGQLRFTSFYMRDMQGNPTGTVATGDPIDFVISYVVPNGVARKASVWFWIRNSLEQGLICLMTSLTDQDFKNLHPKGEFICRVPRFPLTAGNYHVMMKADVDGRRADEIRHAARIQVINGDFFGTGRAIEIQGVYVTDHSWSVIPISS